MPGPKDIFSAKEAPNPAGYDFLALSFWVDKGTVNAGSAQYMETVKEQTKGSHTSLVIVPKTLIWNWESEAKRFAPDLRLLVYAGAARGKLLSGLCDAYLVITSYGGLIITSATLCSSF